MLGEDIVDLRRHRPDQHPTRVTLSEDDLRQKDGTTRAAAQPRNRLGRKSSSVDESRAFSLRFPVPSEKTVRDESSGTVPNSAHSKVRSSTGVEPRRKAVPSPVSFEISTDDRAAVVTGASRGSSRAEKGMTPVQTPQQRRLAPLRTPVQLSTRGSLLSSDRSHGRESVHRHSSSSGKIPVQELRDEVHVSDDDCELCRWALVYDEMKKKGRPRGISEQYKMLKKYLSELERDQ